MAYSETSNYERVFSVDEACLDVTEGDLRHRLG
jgi:hypothetical protein